MIKSVILMLALAQQPTDTSKFLSPADKIALSKEYESAEKYEEAIEILQTISHSDTSHLEVQVRLMELFEEQGQYDEAIAIGEKHKNDLSEFRNDFYVNLGNTHVANKDYEKARAVYQEALTHFPYDYILLFNVGLTYYHQKDYESAQVYFQRSMMINPFYPSNHVILGYISVLQGHISKGMLSYLTYLCISPGSNGVLVYLNDMVNDGAREEGSIIAFNDNSDFQYYDDLIRSGAALDPRFQQAVNFDAPIVKQTELLLSKLKYKESTGDMWMDTYVPYFEDIQQATLSPALIYFILASTDSEDVVNWIKEHPNQKDEWITIANEHLEQMRSEQKANILGKEQLYDFWFFDNNSLSAIGNMNQNDVKSGPWEYYYESGQLESTGEYNFEGDLIGEWTFYHENGRVSRKEYYDQKGNLVKPSEYFYKNGSLYIVANYDSENELDGFVEYYHRCGQIKEQYPYSHGAKTGEGKWYYPTGQLNVDYTIKDGKLEGEHITYHKNGQIQKKGIVEDGLYNGSYTSYYDNGQEYENGTYKSDSLDGEWIGYHKNGVKQYEGSFNMEKKIGEWKYYHTNGNISEIELYDENGNLEGDTKFFTKQGKLFNTETYRNDLLIGYKFFDQNGNVISEAANADGDLPYRSYHETGELKTEATLKNGELEGPFVAYDKNGIIIKKGTMKEGQFHGLYEEFYTTGQISDRGYYENGEFNGLYTQYYKTGGVKAEGWLVDNESEQLWRLYYPDGNIDEERYFISGELQGDYTYYAPGNKKDKVFKYDDDVMVGLAQYDSTGALFYEQELSLGTGPRIHKSVSGDTVFITSMKCGEFDSDIEEFYLGGQKMSVLEVKDNMYNGSYEYYAASGKLEVSGNYLDDERHGEWKWRFANGNISSKSLYDRGERKGISIANHFNGNRELESQYMDGELEGARKYFDQSGELSLIKLYDSEDGHIAYINVQSGDTITFNPKGEFQLKSYFKNGKLAVEQNYLNGRFHGISNYYNADGTLIESINYQFGDYHGKNVVYYSNGKVFREVNYDNDMKHGAENEYYPSGKLRKVTPYYFDNIHGTEVLYNEDGSVNKKTIYWNGDIY